MNVILKSILAISLVAFFGSQALADDDSKKSGTSKDSQSELRKGMREHAKSNMTPEELKKMHQKVKKQMEKMNPVEREMLREELNKENDSMSEEQRSAVRKQMHDHANSKMTSDELDDMHLKVRENMQNRK